MVQIKGAASPATASSSDPLSRMQAELLKAQKASKAIPVLPSPGQSGQSNGNAQQAHNRSQGAHGRANAAAAQGQNAPAATALKPLDLDAINALITGLQERLEVSLPGAGVADLSKPTTDAGQPLKRIMPSAYEGDGLAGADRPNARDISNAVVATTGDKPNSKGASDAFWLWGQFLDHDMDATAGSEDKAPIHIPTGDTTFDPQGTGSQELDFKRSRGVENVFGDRQQINEITALIDGSNVYGSSTEQTDSLRSHEGGKLRMGEVNDLPSDERGFYVAGDKRVNENIGLTAMHTVFAREHNRIAGELAQQHPDWNDQQLFTEARRINVAQMQAITYNEFLPMLLGEQGAGAYQGWSPFVDGQVSNSFATAGYRLGHSLVSDNLTLVDENGTSRQLALRDAFFRPDKVSEEGIDDIMRGVAAGQAQELDTEIVDSLRNFVMESPHSPRLDLAALNIQRGRDHGLPGLNEARQALGLPRIESFDDPIFREGEGAKLAAIYDSPDDVDLWVGMLAEKPVGDGMVGETQAAVLTDQFSRTRAGDPNWYERTFSGGQLDAIRSTTLSDIVERNTGADVQDEMMKTPGAAVA